MKSRVTHGTPVNHIGPSGASVGNREGFGSAGGPQGYSGTVNKQFQGDQKGNRQEGIASGTPANHLRGNPDETRRVRADHRYGVIPVNGGQDMNSPSSNGNGTLFDGMSRERGYNPKAAATMDSPVMHGAPALNTRAIRQENLAHLGQGTGADPAQAADVITNIGGVMSK